MEITLHSKPHTIRAIKIEFPSGKVPAWVVEANKDGRLSVTCNSKDNYITLYQGVNVARGYPGQYLCINDSGTMFFLNQDEVDRGFTKHG